MRFVKATAQRVGTPVGRSRSYGLEDPTGQRHGLRTNPDSKKGGNIRGWKDGDKEDLICRFHVDRQESRVEQGRPFFVAEIRDGFWFFWRIGYY